MSLPVYWVACINPVEKGFLPGTKVQLTQCIECHYSGCAMKATLFKTYFTESVSLEFSSLNKKLMELNAKIAKKAGQSRLYCPRKSEPTTACVGYTKFCKFNQICGKITTRDGRNFIQYIRWRKIMIYVVKFNDGTIKIIDKNDFSSVNIDSVEIVYPGNLEVQIVTELVPQGEEKEKMTETVQTFREKYTGDVVTRDGLVEFERWFGEAKTGDTAIIPEHALIPQKSYRVVKIKTEEKKVKKENEKDVQPNIFDMVELPEISVPVEPVQKPKKPKK